MLLMSLFFAAILLRVAHSAARPYPKPTRWSKFLIVGACVVLGPWFLMFASPVNAGLFALLALALLVWPVARRKVSRFLPLSVAAFAIAYGVAGWHAIEQQAAASRLRAKYPFESMADRVPEPRPDLRAPLNAAAGARLNDFEQVVQSEARGTFRNYQLQRLHEDTVGAFVNSPGFGVARMMGPPTGESLKDRSDRDDVPAQPGSPALWPGGMPYVVVNEMDRDSLNGLHANGLLDFVNPRGWGYVKEGRKAAGFLPHGFSRVPAADNWQVQRIELVGLLKHPEPVVYPSDRLPAMADLHNAPTRPLDPFETAGIAAVRRGEEGFAARRGDEVRFVGAIRSAKQCVECHGGERGDLLGAFAYALRPAEAPAVITGRSR